MPSLGGVAATLRLLGSGRPPLDRFRLALEFAISGHHDFDRMIEHHARMARTLGEQLGLSQAVLEAVDSFYVPGGHRQRADAGTEYLQFSPAAELKVVSETLIRNLQRLQE